MTSKNMFNIMEDFIAITDLLDGFGLLYKMILVVRKDIYF